MEENSPHEPWLNCEAAAARGREDGGKRSIFFCQNVEEKRKIPTTEKSHEKVFGKFPKWRWREDAVRSRLC